MILILNSLYFLTFLYVVFFFLKSSVKIFQNLHLISFLQGYNFPLFLVCTYVSKFERLCNHHTFQELDEYFLNQVIKLSLNLLKPNHKTFQTLGLANLYSQLMQGLKLQTQSKFHVILHIINIVTYRFKKKILVYYNNLY